MLPTHIELPPGTPWWAVWFLVFLIVITRCVAQILKIVIPPTAHLPRWWRDLLEYLRLRKGERREEQSQSQDDARRGE